MQTSVINWLDNVVTQFPNKTAFYDTSSQITFSEFNEYTKNIGTFVAQRVSPLSPVIVMTGRHIMTPACYLGVARAGCFYAAMDAAMPVHRLNQIIGVIKSAHMIVDREHLEIAESLDFSGDIYWRHRLMQSYLQKLQQISRSKRPFMRFSPRVQQAFPRELLLPIIP